MLGYELAQPGQVPFGVVLAQVDGEVGDRPGVRLVVAERPGPQGPAGPGQPSALASLGGLISPFTLLGGLLRWLQAPRGDRVQAQMIQATVIGRYGWVYGVVFVVLTAAAIGGLFARYRRVGIA